MSTFLTGDSMTPPEVLLSSSATQEALPGQRFVSGDGREFRYVKNGAVAMVPGKLYQAPAEVTGDQDLACAAAAIGAKSITTTSTVTVTANQYAGGWVTVGVTPGQGQQYKILSHPAATAAAVTLTLEDPIVVALTTSSRIDLVANPYKGVVVNPTTATSAPVGAAVYAVAANEWGFIQTKGTCNLLADGTVTVGTGVVASNATAGAVEALTGVQAPVGVAQTGIATTEYGPIILDLY